MRVWRAVVGGAVLAVVSWSVPAAAQAMTLAEWQMNETAGSTQMVDSSGNGLNARIGSSVVLHEANPTGFGYRFRGDWWVVNDERLVTINDDPRLDPGTQPYAVTIRFKTGAVDANIIQKGQSNQTGGYWKLALQKGWPRCHFRDAAGTTKAIGFVNDARPATMVADNQWHTLRCERSTTGVKITVNYGEPTAISKFIKGTIGRVDNTRPLSLGGKLDCNGTTVTCDYLAGAVDWVTLDRPGL
jgi:Laminin G domain